MVSSLAQVWVLVLISGSMFIPVDDDKMGYNQHVWRIEKDGNGEVTKKQLFGVRYVPLTEAPK